MQLPPEIVFKGVETTSQINELVSRGIARLEQICDYIISTRIAIEQAQGRHQTGNPYRMRIDIRIPGRPEIIVKRSSKALRKIPDGHAAAQTASALRGLPEPKESQPVRRSPLPQRGKRDEPLMALIRRTFDVARREIEKTVEKQRGEVKTPAYQTLLAVVEKIFREEGYGFVRTLDGQQVYFHKNSVLHGHWEDLKVGTAVRYTPELGEKGLQASTLEPVEKLGAAESHDELHELPAVSPARSRKKL